MQKNVYFARKKLKENGAEFIICFFDENSDNKWNIMGYDDETCAEYEFLIDWVMEDPTIGVIFKPKNSTNLFKRISRIKNKIKDALITGRCLFYKSELICGNIYPVEAALCSDVCIGKLIGATAAFESRLAGIPTVLIDNENLIDHPIYSWGYGSVLFNNWEKLKTEIAKYRHSPDKNKNFGDWQNGISDLDPYRDGRASYRMEEFISSVYDELKKDNSRYSALKVAAQKYIIENGKGSLSLNQEINCKKPIYKAYSKR